MTSALPRICILSSTRVRSSRRRAAQAEMAEGALRLSEAQYRLLFESNPSPLWVYDEHSLAFLAVNEAAIEKYGYSRDEFLAMTIRDIRPPETIPVLEAALVRRRAERGQTGTRQTWKHLTKAGRVIEVEMAGHPLWFQSREAWLALANDGPTVICVKTDREANLMLPQDMMMRFVEVYQGPGE